MATMSLFQVEAATEAYRENQYQSYLSVMMDEETQIFEEDFIEAILDDGSITIDNYCYTMEDVLDQIWGSVKNCEEHEAIMKKALATMPGKADSPDRHYDELVRFMDKMARQLFQEKVA